MSNGGSNVARGGAATNTIADTAVLKIHPAIGAARVGDADEFFIGPELPGQGATGQADGVGTTVPPTAGASFRHGHSIKRQAARFRVFWYPPGNKEPEELTLDHPEVDSIKWTVHLANRKASFFKFKGLRGSSGPFTAGGIPRRNPGTAADFEIDPGPRDIDGAKAGGTDARKFIPASSPGTATWPKFAPGHAHAGSPVIEFLGELKTDEKGRLLVLGGKGVSKCSVDPYIKISDYANNPNWFDDVSDGFVKAAVTLKSTGKAVQAAPAWVLVGPPDFAPAVANLVTLYDTVYDVAINHLPIPNTVVYNRFPLNRMKDLKNNRATYKPVWGDEILPIFERTRNYRWVNEPASSIHASLLHVDLSDASAAKQGAREAKFNYLRPDTGDVALYGDKSMPKLYGDNYDKGNTDPKYMLAVTKTMYHVLKRWKDGQFDVITGPMPPPTITPEGLDKAALENCVGGAFFPGIELSWLVRYKAVYSEPFRVNLGATVGVLTVRPGFFSQQMALPWQADFAACERGTPGGVNIGWWPAQRPDDVFLPGASSMVPWGRGVVSMDAMVTKWQTRGFVVQDGTKMVEKDKHP